MIRTPRRGGDAGDRELLTGDVGDAPSTARESKEADRSQAKPSDTVRTYLSFVWEGVKGRVRDSPVEGGCCRKAGLIRSAEGEC